MAGVLVALLLAAGSWVGGHLVFGKGSPSEQCSHADSTDVIGWNPNDHVDDPIEAWYPIRTEFTPFPTGLTCTYRNADTGRTGTSRYITWDATIACTAFGAIGIACLLGAALPHRPRPDES